jgi:hypothetical protein
MAASPHGEKAQDEGSTAEGIAATPDSRARGNDDDTESGPGSAGRGLSMESRRQLPFTGMY